MATIASYNYDTFAALRASTASGTTPKVMHVWGYYAPGDGGVSSWMFFPKSTEAPDDLYVVKPSNISLASPGRYHRLVTDGTVNVLSAGLRGDFNDWGNPLTGFDNAPLLNRLIEAAPRFGVHTLYLPPTYRPGAQQAHHYLFRSPVKVTTRVRITGAPSAVWVPTTTLLFYECGGIELLGGVPYAEDGTCRWTFNEAVLEHLAVLGRQAHTPAAPFPTEGDYVGVYINCHHRVSNVYVSGFTSDGFRVHGNAADRPLSTNLNCSRMDMCMAQYNAGDGLKIRGGDVNVTLVTQFNAVSNKYWGVLDESLLGVTLLNPHFANNGVFGKDEASYPSGRTFITDEAGVPHYFIARRDSVGVRPVVGVSDAYYTYYGTHNQYGLHTEWKEDRPIRGCGAYKSTRAVNASLVLGGYTEENQGHSHLTGQTTVLGGFHGTPVYGKHGEVGIWGSESGARIGGALTTREVQFEQGGSIGAQAKYAAFQITSGGLNMYLNTQGAALYAGPTNPFTLVLNEKGQASVQGRLL
jgi:hypothetical protein